MGNLCSDSADNGPVVVYGDYLDVDTRILLSILTHCNIQHKLQD